MPRRLFQSKCTDSQLGNGWLQAFHAPPRKPASPFRYFNSSPEVIRLVVMLYVRFRLCQTKCTSR